MDAQLPTGQKPYRAVHVFLLTYGGADASFAKENMDLVRMFENEFHVACRLIRKQRVQVERHR